MLDRFLHKSAADTACADLHSFRSATWKSDTNSLQVRTELSPGLASDFCTDTPKVFGFTAGLDTVAHLRAFSANFTNACHDAPKSQRISISVEGQNYSGRDAPRNREIIGILTIKLEAA